MEKNSMVKEQRVKDLTQEKDGVVMMALFPLKVKEILYKEVSI
jgi:hypothetical protein